MRNAALQIWISQNPYGYDVPVHTSCHRHAHESEVSEKLESASADFAVIHHYFELVLQRAVKRRSRKSERASRDRQEEHDLII